MTELDLMLWISFGLGIATGFAAGYVLCYRRQLAIRERMLADARLLASLNDRLYRNALAGRYRDQSGPSYQPRPDRTPGEPIPWLGRVT